MTVVAIDGPAGSGKSTVARALAQRLGVPHVDTGAFYRAATLAVLRAGVHPDDAEACTRIAQSSVVVRKDDRTYLDGEDVEAEIRGLAVTATVSSVAAHPGVRRALVRMQRAMVAPDGAVVEGRDAGTVVVPHAELKVWLTASPLARAERRATQVGEGATPQTLAAHADDLARRDAQDAERMLRAPDVVDVDTTGRTVESLVQELVMLVEVKGQA